MTRRTAGWALVVAWAATAGAGLAQTASDQPLYTQRSSFAIPFRVDPVALEQLGSNELRLYFSEDRGGNWSIYGSVEPSAGRFIWNAPADGEYWFAVRTVDDRGRLHPGDGQPFEPELRVVVDTRPPVLLLSPDPASAQPSVHWQFSDDNLIPESLSIRYALVPPAGRAAGQLQWKPAQVSPDSAQIGNVRSGRVQLTDAGGRDVLVRAEGRDRAGNVATAQTQIGSSGLVNQELLADHDPNSGRAGTVTSNRPITLDSRDAPNDSQTRRKPDAVRGPMYRSNVPSYPRANRQSDHEPLTPRSQAGAELNRNRSRIPGRSDDRTADPVPQIAGGGTQIINTTQFDIHYQLEAIGPSGVGNVDLWVTEDRGETWKLYGPDRDRRSPLRVDVGKGKQGLFGFALVASSGVGLAAPAPAPGEAPQMQVLVDTTPPNVNLRRPEAATDSRGSHVVIRWDATDANLAETPVSLYWAASPNGPWTPIAERLKNVPSAFKWYNLPPNVPHVYVRLVVQDRAGNQVDLNAPQPVVIDLARPRAKIIGVRRS